MRFLATGSRQQVQASFADVIYDWEGGGKLRAVRKGELNIKFYEFSLYLLAIAAPVRLIQSMTVCLAMLPLPGIVSATGLGGIRLGGAIVTRVLVRGQLLSSAALAAPGTLGNGDTGVRRVLPRLGGGHEFSDFFLPLTNGPDGGAGSHSC